MENEVSTKPQEKHGNKSAIIGITVGSIIGLAGIAFGIYGMTRSPETPTPKPEDNTAKTEVRFGFQASNFDGDIEYTVSSGLPDAEDAKIKHSMTVASPNDSYGGSYVLSADGKLKAFKNQWPYGESKDITSVLGGTPVDLAVGQLGNGGDTWLIALLSDGTVVTVDEYTHTKANKVEGAENTVRVYGNFTDSVGYLGYTQDKDGKFHKIVKSTTEDSGDEWTFRVR